MKKYMVYFYNNYEDKWEAFGDYNTEAEAWEATDAYPELDFKVYKEL